MRLLHGGVLRCNASRSPPHNTVLSASTTMGKRALGSTTPPRASRRSVKHAICKVAGGNVPGFATIDNPLSQSCPPELISMILVGACAYLRQTVANRSQMTSSIGGLRVAGMVVILKSSSAGMDAGRSTTKPDSVTSSAALEDLEDFAAGGCLGSGAALPAAFLVLGCGTSLGVAGADFTGAAFGGVTGASP